MISKFLKTEVNAVSHQIEVKTVKHYICMFIYNLHKLIIKMFSMNFIQFEKLDHYAVLYVAEKLKCKFHFGTGVVFVPTIKNGEKHVFGFVLVFLFFTQNLVPQKSIRLGYVIYHDKALPVMVRTTLNISRCREKPVWNLIFGLILS